MKYLILVWVPEGEEDSGMTHDGWNLLYWSNNRQDADARFRKSKGNWRKVKLVKVEDIVMQEND